MSVLTIRMREDKCDRLKALAERRATTVNRLIDEMATLLLAEFDSETRFQLRAGRGRNCAQHGTALLRKAKGT